MDIRFSPYNTHLDNAQTFAKTDPHLKRLYAEKYIYFSPLIKKLPREAGIYTLGGGRQIGKTTLLKQWMEFLLSEGVSPKAIVFFSGELINDYQSLYQLIVQQLSEMPEDVLKYIILDEVTYIDGWDKTIKHLSDAGFLEKTMMVLSGSDLVLMQDARKRFPGRRGYAAQVDFHYYPLSFSEFIKLKDAYPKSIENVKNAEMRQLFLEFDSYLIHGGFLSAINNYARNNTINMSTLMTYSDWIRGDMLKKNKREHYLKEILAGIIKHYCKQISWTNLQKELSIDHVMTISDYINLLESMDAVFIQNAIIEDKLVAAPKKHKKVMFCDPFIFHAISAWLEPCDDPFQEQILLIFNNPKLYSDLVESCVVTHFRRYWPTFYIKAEGEVDIAYVHKKKMWPIEIKWTNQLRPNDLKQISKYKNAQIFAKSDQLSTINDIPVTPLPLGLLQLGDID